MISLLHNSHPFAIRSLTESSKVKGLLHFELCKPWVSEGRASAMHSSYKVYKSLKTMAPVKPPKTIKLTVPRQNAQRVNSKMAAEIKRQGKAKGIVVDTARPSGRLNGAVVSYLLNFGFGRQGIDNMVVILVG